jgi:hypothetical protein
MKLMILVCQDFTPNVRKEEEWRITIENASHVNEALNGCKRAWMHQGTIHWNDLRGRAVQPSGDLDALLNEAERFESEVHEKVTRAGRSGTEPNHLELCICVSTREWPKLKTAITQRKLPSEVIQSVNGRIQITSEPFMG